MPNPRPRRGFTLIELLSVMAIIGVLAGIGIPKYHDAVERARVAKAIGDLRALATDINGLSPLPSSLASIGRGALLDPWGQPYVYYPFPPSKGNGGGHPPGARMDRFLVPINSLFDLYSMGKDGKSVAPLTAKDSHDDVIMANDGGYYGLAKNY
jgi:general secretion pathway protein G